MSVALVFVSRLAGLPVLASDGSLVGRITDVVIAYPAADTAPPVVGFVAEVQRRHIFVNVNRVSELDNNGARMYTGTVDLRRFKLRTGELLVRKDLFDQRLGRETINDVALRRVPGSLREWQVSGVSFVATGLLRRRRSGRLTGWEPLLPYFTGISEITQQTAEIRELHPAEAAEQFAAMDPSERAKVAEALDNEELADLLGELPENEQVEVIESLDVERAADVIEEMEPDDAADLLAELPALEREEVLNAMDPEEAGSLRRLLEYSPDTAGGLMNPYPLVLSGDATVAEALARIRDPDLPAAEAAHVFVCEAPLETPTGRYLGPVGYQRLLREPPSTRLAGCLDDDPKPVGADLTLAATARRLASYDVVALPVCDQQGRLLGAVSVDDVLDHLLPIGWRRR